MSDDEYMMDEDDDFNYEDDEEEEEEGEEADKDAQMEELYYKAKEFQENSKNEKALQTLVSMREIEANSKSQLGFKALKRSTSLCFSLGRHKEGLDTYRLFLGYFDKFSSNDTEKAVNKILDKASNLPIDVVQELYDSSLKAFLDNKNERVWFRIKLKLAQVLFDKQEFKKLNKIVEELRQSCKLPNGQMDEKKGTQLMEIYAMEIQMYTETKNSKKLKETYERAFSVQNAISHPKIMGVIRECGGKMHMAEKEWDKAYNEFFEAFKMWDETGLPRRIQCLKYCVLANILRLSNIDVFDSPEAKPYKNDPEITAMTQLVIHFRNNDVKMFEKILKDNKDTIMGDPFIRLYIEDVLRNIRIKVLQVILRPYTNISIAHISTELRVPAAEVESLLIALILDGKIQGRIDQVNQLLALEQTATVVNSQKYSAISKWGTQMGSISKTVFARVF